MPEKEGFARRKLVRDDGPAEAIPPAAFVELGVATPFSFLRGVSDPIELVLTALELGMDAIGVADRNTLAGVVRMHSACKGAGLRPLIGCRLEVAVPQPSAPVLQFARPERSAKRVVEGRSTDRTSERPSTTACGIRSGRAEGSDLERTATLLAYPIDREGYGRLSRLLSGGKMRSDKGECRITLDEVAEQAEGIAFIAWPDAGLDAFNFVPA